MKYILDCEKSALLDQVSINEYGIPSLVLMERAALALAERIKENVKLSDRILVVCGIGNNGGDGVASGRILAEWGYDLSVFVLGEKEKASEEMKAQLVIAEKSGVKFCDEPEISGFTVVVDAMFGIGLSREITGRYQEWIKKINESGCLVISADIPSGVSADTGEIFGIAVKADITVTFGTQKMGMLFAPGALQAGKIYVEDIGFPNKALEQILPNGFYYTREDIGRLFPQRKPFSHKGSYGKLLVVAGSKEIGGAALFAAKAAYRMGCGLVKVVTHKNNRTMLQENLPECLLSVYEKEGYDLKKEIAWASAILIGPGLGTGKQAKALMKQVLEVRDKPVLIDADGLNLLAKKDESAKSGEISLPDNFVLTPHLLEMSRLIGDPVEMIKADLPGYARKTKNGAVLVLKDARTIVSDGELIYVNVSGNHALAKGGSGDVLSGMIAGLLARGQNAYWAATLGVYLHGIAAEEYIVENSSSSMLASDLLNQLAHVLP